MEGFNDGVRDIVVAHHEYKNTEPYPRNGQERRHQLRNVDERRVPKDKAHRLGEIVAVCDLYDALAFSRSYKPAFSLDRIEQVLREEFTGDVKYIAQVLERHS